MTKASLQNTKKEIPTMKTSNSFPYQNEVVFVDGKKPQSKQF
jgi:hypothetical protein